MVRSLMAAGVVAAALCSTAQAGVVYNWQPDAANIYASSGRLEIDSAAWSSGSVSYSAAGGAFGPFQADFTCPTFATCGDPSAPIVSFRLGIRESGLAFFPQTYIEPRMLGRFGLSIAPDGRLGGSIYLFEGMGDSEMRLSSTAGVWNANFLFGFLGSVCNQNGGCNAAGTWALDPTTVPGFVPEPGALPLVALGVFGLAASLRRARVVAEGA